MQEGYSSFVRVNLLGMPHLNRKILLLLFLLPFCKNKQSLENQIIVSVEQASLRAEPSEKSQEIVLLRKGQYLTDLGEVSQSESQTAVGGHVYQTPWIKVQTAGNQTGWVLPWALRPFERQQDWLLQKRLVCYFGKNLAIRRNELLRQFEDLGADERVSDVWRESDLLRDTFLSILSRRPETGGPQPQFEWLNEVLPGFLYQKMGEGSRPYLFADFIFWQQKALETKGIQDDAFFQTCLAAFPNDSIESFFPVWKFQLSDVESASQLGTGQHLKMFQQIDQSMTLGSLFATPLEILKEQILEDIFEKDVRYWQSGEKILAEIGQILAAPPKCLHARELEALAIRQKMFEEPVKNGVVVNLRSGE